MDEAYSPPRAHSHQAVAIGKSGHPRCRPWVRNRNSCAGLPVSGHYRMTASGVDTSLLGFEWRRPTHVFALVLRRGNPRYSVCIVGITRALRRPANSSVPRHKVVCVLYASEVNLWRTELIRTPLQVPVTRGNALGSSRIDAVQLCPSGAVRLCCRYDWPKELNSALLEELFSLDFIEQPANIVLIGPNGFGKTMIAKNLLHQAILHGYTARFTPPPTCCTIWPLRTLLAARAPTAALHHPDRPWALMRWATFLRLALR